jgi:hypothetical protein
MFEYKENYHVMTKEPTDNLHDNRPVKRVIIRRPPSLIFARDDDYKYGLSETMRIERGVMKDLPLSMFDEVKYWEQHITLNYTKHALDRMHQYVDRISDRPWIDGYYFTEMFFSEYDYLKNPRNLQRHLNQAKIVELGLNDRYQICKVSFILQLDRVCPFLYDKSEPRCLFFCVTPGGFLKTINICPGEKINHSYGGKVEYLSLRKVMNMVYR